MLSQACFLSPSQQADGPTEHLFRQETQTLASSFLPSGYFLVYREGFSGFWCSRRGKGGTKPGDWQTARQQTPLVPSNWVTRKVRFRCSFAASDKQWDQCVVAFGCQHEVNKPQKQQRPPQQSLTSKQEDHKDNPGVSCRLRLPPASRFD